MPMELVTELPYDHPYRWDGTLFGGPKLWRPNDITGGLALWLDAEDASTITLNGSTVSQWADKSGNGRNATQATVVNQPTYSATGFNNKPAIVFNNKILENTSTSLKLISRTLFFVAIETTRASFTGIFALKPATGNDYEQTNGFTVTTGSSVGASNFEIAGSTGISYRPVIPVNEAVFGIYGEVKQAGLGQIYRNGTLQASDNSFVEFNVNSAGGMRIGSRYTGNGIIGNLAEVIYLESTASVDTRQKLEGYLAWKWNLQSNLPSGHPFKNLPPTV